MLTNDVRSQFKYVHPHPAQLRYLIEGDEVREVYPFIEGPKINPDWERAELEVFYGINETGPSSVIVALTTPRPSGDLVCLGASRTGSPA